MTDEQFLKAAHIETFATPAEATQEWEEKNATWCMHQQPASECKHNVCGFRDLLRRIENIDQMLKMGITG